MGISNYSIEQHKFFQSELIRKASEILPKSSLMSVIDKLVITNQTLLLCTLPIVQKCILNICKAEGVDGFEKTLKVIEEHPLDELQLEVMDKPFMYKILSDDKIEFREALKIVSKHTVDFPQVTSLNSMSEDIIDGKLTLEEAYSKVENPPVNEPVIEPSWFSKIINYILSFFGLGSSESHHSVKEVLVPSSNNADAKVKLPESNKEAINEELHPQNDIVNEGE